MLGHLLLEAGFFDADMKSPEDIAVENFMKKILKQMGVYDHPNKMKQFINGLMEIQDA